jgi:hypothetical protein
MIKLLFRRARAQVALETMVVLMSWFIATGFLLNVFFYFGSAMMVQMQANRLALQAGAAGCLVVPSAQSLTSQVAGLGVHVDSVQAGSPLGVSSSTIDQQQYGSKSVLGTDDVFNFQGGQVDPSSPLLSSLQDATCPTPPAGETLDQDPAAAAHIIPAGHYITVTISYHQYLWMGGLFGSPEVVRSATVLSQTGTQALR